MIKRLLDKLESRIDYLEMLIGSWDSQLENQKNILTSLDFLEEAIASIYLDNFQLSDDVYHSLNSIISLEMTDLNKDHHQEHLHYCISLYYEDMKIMNEKLKQIDDLYCNRFLKNIERFNDIPSNQLLMVSNLTRNYYRLRQIVMTQNRLVLQAISLVRKFIDKSLVTTD
ncbi:Ldb18p PWA37_000553 [Arxiozyma heterogenica]|uniref:Uncharacterized protein n=1 Tax=Arxiozyma heterogenica TaxID=278026 RepID=A0AAN7ZZA0_9SACH|nr:hypothetical protein RI543_000060 [Kazachstania heterogenica]